MSEIELHRKLLGDAPRNEAFAAALRAAIVPGESTVADLGAGTGFLSFLARRLGARHCTLVEYSDALALAASLARANGIDGLSFVHAHSSEVRKPERCDVVVSETLGNYALEESLLETLVDARRFLKPGGRLIPARLRQFVAPVGAARLQREIDIWGGIGHGLDFAPARQVALNNLYVKTIVPLDLAAGEAAARLWDDLDFDPAAKAPPSRRRAVVQWQAEELAPPTVQGLALWWEATLAPGIAISTSPFSPPTHWEQIYLPLLAPVTLAPRDRLELTLESDTRPQVGLRVQWQLRQRRGRRVVAAQALDSFAGRL